MGKVVLLVKPFVLQTSRLWILKYLLSHRAYSPTLIRTKESFYVKKEFNSNRVVLVHQRGRRFIVLEHQYSRRDVM